MSGFKELKISDMLIGIPEGFHLADDGVGIEKDKPLAGDTSGYMCKCLEQCTLVTIDKGIYQWWCPSCRTMYKVQPIGCDGIEEPLGIKHDSDKLEWKLLPLREVEEVIKVLMHGARKYKPDNWKYVKPKERYLDAAFRHLAARAKGEMLDSESGISHLAHLVACCLFLLWHDTEDAK